MDVAYINGQYAIRSLSAAGPADFWVPLPGRFADATVAVDASLVGLTRDRYIMVACRYDDVQATRYVLAVRPDVGRAALLLGRGADYSFLKDWTAMPEIQRDSATNRLELACVGGTISASVNRAPLASVQDASFTAGQLAVGAGHFPDARVVLEGRFDNLEAHAP
jgi:hypothetical protein